MDNLYCSLDIGSSMVKALVGRYGANGVFDVLGIGYHKGDTGIQAGLITNRELLVRNVSVAIGKALAMAKLPQKNLSQDGAPIADVVVGIPGPFLGSRHLLTAKIISESILEQGGILENFTINPNCCLLSENSSLVHINQLGSYESSRTHEFMDTKERRIEAIGTLVTGSKFHVAKLLEIVSESGHKPGHMIGVPFAIGKALAKERFVARRVPQRGFASWSATGREGVASGGARAASREPSGLCVIDIGAATTEVSIFSGGKNIFVKSIPMAGDHITKSVMRDLRLSKVQAEICKVLVGVCDPHYLSGADESLAEFPRFDRKLLDDISQILKENSAPLFQEGAEVTYGGLMESAWRRQTEMEEEKLFGGRSTDGVKTKSTIGSKGGVANFQDRVMMVIRAITRSLEDIFAKVFDHVLDEGFDVDELDGGMVLTGGSSLIHGILPLAEEIFYRRHFGQYKDFSLGENMPKEVCDRLARLAMRRSELLAVKNGAGSGAIASQSRGGVDGAVARDGGGKVDWRSASQYANDPDAGERSSARGDAGAPRNEAAIMADELKREFTSPRGEEDPEYHKPETPYWVKEKPSQEGFFINREELEKDDVVLVEDAQGAAFDENGVLVDGQSGESGMRDGQGQSDENDGFGLGGIDLGGPPPHRDGADASRIGGYAGSRDLSGDVSLVDPNELHNAGKSDKDGGEKKPNGLGGDSTKFTNSPTLTMEDVEKSEMARHSGSGMGRKDNLSFSFQKDGGVINLDGGKTDMDPSMPTYSKVIDIEDSKRKMARMEASAKERAAFNAKREETGGRFESRKEVESAKTEEKRVVDLESGESLDDGITLMPSGSMEASSPNHEDTDASAQGKERNAPARTDAAIDDAEDDSPGEFHDSESMEASNDALEGESTENESGLTNSKAGNEGGAEQKHSHEVADGAEEFAEVEEVEEIDASRDEIIRGPSASMASSASPRTMADDEPEIISESNMRREGLESRNRNKYQFNFDRSPMSPGDIETAPAGRNGPSAYNGNWEANEFDDIELLDEAGQADMDDGGKIGGGEGPVEGGIITKTDVSKTLMKKGLLSHPAKRRDDGMGSSMQTQSSSGIIGRDERLKEKIERSKVSFTHFEDQVGLGDSSRSGISIVGAKNTSAPQGFNASSQEIHANPAQANVGSYQTGEPAGVESSSDRKDDFSNHGSNVPPAKNEPNSAKPASNEKTPKSQGADTDGDLDESGQDSQKSAVESAGFMNGEDAASESDHESEENSLPDSKDGEEESASSNESSEGDGDDGDSTKSDGSRKKKKSKNTRSNMARNFQSRTWKPGGGDDPSNEKAETNEASTGNDGDEKSAQANDEDVKSSSSPSENNLQENGESSIGPQEEKTASSNLANQQAANVSNETDSDVPAKPTDNDSSESSQEDPEDNPTENAQDSSKDDVGANAQSGSSSPIGKDDEESDGDGKADENIDESASNYDPSDEPAILVKAAAEEGAEKITPPSESEVDGEESPKSFSDLLRAARELKAKSKSEDGKNGGKTIAELEKEIRERCNLELPESESEEDEPIDDGSEDLEVSEASEDSEDSDKDASLVSNDKVEDESEPKLDSDETREDAPSHDVVESELHESGEVDQKDEDGTALEAEDSTQVEVSSGNEKENNSDKEVFQTSSQSGKADEGDFVYRNGEKIPVLRNIVKVPDGSIGNVKDDSNEEDKDDEVSKDGDGQSPTGSQEAKPNADEADGADSVNEPSSEDSTNDSPLSSSNDGATDDAGSSTQTSPDEIEVEVVEVDGESSIEDSGNTVKDDGQESEEDANVEEEVKEDNAESTQAVDLRNDDVGEDGLVEIDCSLEEASNENGNSANDSSEAETAEEPADKEVEVVVDGNNQDEAISQDKLAKDGEVSGRQSSEDGADGSVDGESDDGSIDGDEIGEGEDSPILLTRSLIEAEAKAMMEANPILPKDYLKGKSCPMNSCVAPDSSQPQSDGKETSPEQALKEASETRDNSSAGSASGGSNQNGKDESVAAQKSEAENQNSEGSTVEASDNSLKTSATDDSKDSDDSAVSDANESNGGSTDVVEGDAKELAASDEGETKDGSPHTTNMNADGDPGAKPSEPEIQTQGGTEEATFVEKDSGGDGGGSEAVLDEGAADSQEHDDSSTSSENGEGPNEESSDGDFMVEVAKDEIDSEDDSETDAKTFKAKGVLKEKPSKLGVAGLQAEESTKGKEEDSLKAKPDEKDEASQSGSLSNKESKEDVASDSKEEETVEVEVSAEDDSRSESMKEVDASAPSEDGQGSVPKNGESPDSNPEGAKAVENEGDADEVEVEIETSEEPNMSNPDGGIKKSGDGDGKAEGDLDLAFGSFQESDNPPEAFDSAATMLTSSDSSKKDRHVGINEFLNARRKGDSPSDTLDGKSELESEVEAGGASAKGVEAADVKTAKNLQSRDGSQVGIDEELEAIRKEFMLYGIDIANLPPLRISRAKLRVDEQSYLSGELSQYFSGALGLLYQALDVEENLLRHGGAKDRDEGKS